MHSTAVSAHERVGNYWHVLPEYAQARKAVWDAINPHTGMRRIDEVFPPEIRQTTREHEMMIKLKCGSTWQLVGSDNTNSLMGSPPIGVVFSEYALSNPSGWAYIRPILLENGGWAMFNTTPRGHNHAEALFKLAQKEPGWFVERLSVDQTEIFTPEQLATELRELTSQYGETYGDAVFRQEYHCSFDAAIMGAIWGDLIERAEVAGRIRSVPYDPEIPVYTAWDLGYDDDTAIWFFQVLAREIHFIDFYASSGKDIAHYADVIRDKGYRYALHWLPHDAKPKTLAAAGRSILEQLVEGGVRPAYIAPSLSVEDGIQAVRKMMPGVWFDAEKCSEGINAIRQYQREYDSDKKMFKDKPRHDWTSHAADALRIAALCWQAQKAQPREVPTEEALLAASVQNQTMGSLMKRHMEKRRRERSEIAA